MKRPMTIRQIEKALRSVLGSGDGAGLVLGVIETKVGTQFCLVVPRLSVKSSDCRLSATLVFDDEARIGSTIEECLTRRRSRR